MSWTLIAKELNTLLHHESSIRVARKCRERWLNHLDPRIKKGNWTEEEDRRLLKLQQKYGNRWSDISKKLEGRNENSVKNRWKSLCKKSVKKKSHDTMSERNESASSPDNASVKSFSPSDFLK